MEKIISESTKSRQGRTYLRTIDGFQKSLDGKPRQWKQIIVLHKQGFKTKKGKTVYRSQTLHVPA